MNRLWAEFLKRLFVLKFSRISRSLSHWQSLRIGRKVAKASWKLEEILKLRSDDAHRAQWLGIVQTLVLWHNENLFNVIGTRESLPASRSGRNLKVKNHRKWKLWGYLIVARLSSRWVSGRVGESWAKESLLLMLRETCNKKINHRLQFSEERREGRVSNFTAAMEVLRCGQPLIYARAFSSRFLNKYQFARPGV